MINPQQPSVPLPTPSPKDFLTTLRQTGPDRLQVAASLLERGVNINCIHEFPKHRPYGGGVIVSRTRVTALYDAAQRGDYEAVQFLLSRGADITAKNLTGMGMCFGDFPKNNAETLCAINGMRTSKNIRIVELAEEMFGVETEEEFVRRRDAFNALRGLSYFRMPGVKEEMSKIRRVESVLPKTRSKKSQARKGHSTEESRKKRHSLRSRNSKRGHSTEDNGEKRYYLRSRNSNLCYA